MIYNKIKNNFFQLPEIVRKILKKNQKPFVFLFSVDDHLVESEKSFQFLQNFQISQKNFLDFQKNEEKILENVEKILNSQENSKKLLFFESSFFMEK